MSECSALVHIKVFTQVHVRDSLLYSESFKNATKFRFFYKLYRNNGKLCDKNVEPPSNLKRKHSSNSILKVSIMNFHILKVVLSEPSFWLHRCRWRMLVTDVGDQMCRWQDLDVGDKLRHQHRELGTNIKYQSPLSHSRVLWCWWPM